MTRFAFRGLSAIRTKYFALLMISGLAGCSQIYECKDAISCLTVIAGDPIKIGVIQALSGKVEPSGHRYLRSVELALDDRKSTLLGHSLVIQAEDGQCTREGGSTAALKIVADPQIAGVVGTTCSGEAKGASPEISKAGLVMISGSNSAASLTALGGDRGDDFQLGYFRTAQNDSDQGKAAAVFAFKKLNIRKVATIDDGDPYTKGLASIFRKEFAALGGDALTSAAINKGDQDMAPVLTSVADSGAELVFLSLFEPEGDFVVQQKAKDSRLSGLKVMSADGLLLGSFLQTTGASASGMYFVAPAKASGPAYDEFEKKYTEKYNEELTTNYHAQTYDAANMLLAAIEKVAVKDSDGTLHIGRQALRDAMYGTKEFKGLTGVLTCNQFGDCGAMPFIGLQIIDPSQKIEVLKASAMFTYP